jgi:hypothetical protein
MFTSRYAPSKEEVTSAKPLTSKESLKVEELVKPQEPLGNNDFIPPHMRHRYGKDTSKGSGSQVLLNRQAFASSAEKAVCTSSAEIKIAKSLVDSQNGGHKNNEPVRNTPMKVKWLVPDPSPLENMSKPHRKEDEYAIAQWSSSPQVASSDR